MLLPGLALVLALPASASRVAAPARAPVASSGLAASAALSLPAAAVATPVAPALPAPPPAPAWRRPTPRLGRRIDAALLALLFDGRAYAAESTAEPVAGTAGETARPARRAGAAPAAEPASEPRAPEPPAPPASTWRRAWRLATAPLKVLTNRPTNDRDWSEDVAVLPEIRIAGERVSIKNARNFDYRSTRDWTRRYYDAEFDLRDLESVWYLVEPFGGGGQAHTFLSFGFKGERYLSVSVEIRRTKGDRFSPWRGLWNGFELTYVIGDERDLVRLRSNYRKDDVFLYPIRGTREKFRELLVDVLARAEGLRSKPEFYNTLTNTCTTNLWRHVNRIAPKKLPYSYKVLLPGYSDRLAYDLGLIDTPLSFEEARARFRINERALAADRAPDFSVKIRKF
ncbi:MAG: DUF4105 domain-containing protein [Elusimicrobia bacterium]|nr:DUF4105 domain-containing protein [Elusimicrobiota bacterium]